MNVLSLFDGISTGRLALEQANVKIDNYYSSEVDKYCIQISNKNYPDIIQLGDITQINFESLPKIDLIIGGSCCQSFSQAGNQKGFDDPRGQLMFKFFQAVYSLNPKYFLLENVKMKQEYKDIISNRLGVEPVEINSDRFVCQNRPRLYFTNIPISELPDRPDWDKQYYQYRRNYWRENKSGVCPCLTANMGTGGNNVPYILDDGIKRVLTINELEELQGLQPEYTSGVSFCQRKKAIGNGWTVPVITHIFKGLTNPV